VSALTSKLAVAAPLVVALAVRALLALDASDGPLLGDEATLRRLAELWREHGVYVGEWPPVFPWLLAQLQRLAGEAAGLALMRGLNVAAATAVVAATMALARELGGRRAALAAGWIAALSPAVAIWGGLLFTEAPFVALTTAALALLARRLNSDEGTRHLPWICGLLLGAAALVRAAGLLLIGAVVVGVFVARGRRGLMRGVADAAAIAALALLVLAPWSVRSTTVAGRSKWASGTGPANIVLGWSGAPIPFERAGLADADVHGAPLGSLRRWLERPGPTVPGPEVLAERGGLAAYAPERVREVLREHPGWAVRSRIVHLAELFSPQSFGHRAARLGQLDGLSARPWLRRAFSLGGALLTVATFACAFWALNRGSLAAAHRRILFGFAAAHVAVPLLMFGISRFRAPLEPVVIAVAALLWSSASAGAARDRRGPDTATAGTLAALYGAGLLVTLPVVWTAVRAGW